MIQNVASIAGTIAETHSVEHHVSALLATMHPGAKVRRVDLPLSHHGTFIPDEEEYGEIIEETEDFLETSDGYQGMLQDFST